MFILMLNSVDACAIVIKDIEIMHGIQTSQITGLCSMPCFAFIGTDRCQISLLILSEVGPIY